MATSTISRQVYEVGVPGNIRAGRELTVQDFLDCGLSAPRALWNLSTLQDSSGNGLHLTNGGTTPPLPTKGVMGDVNGARYFSGQGATPPFLSAPSTAQQAYGSWSCWFRSARKDLYQDLISVYDAGGLLSYEMQIGGARGNVRALISVSGNDTVFWFSEGQSYVCDNKFHFVTYTWDGSFIQIFLDGRLDFMGRIPFGAAVPGPLYTGHAKPVYIGSRQVNVNARVAGTIDEVSICPEVMTLAQHRHLMAAKIEHNQENATTRKLGVYFDRYTRTSKYEASDFPTQPLVGYNFNSGHLYRDNYGSLSKHLGSVVGTLTEYSDVDGSSTGGVASTTGVASYFQASDTGLPASSESFTASVWLKWSDLSSWAGFMAFGNSIGTGAFRIYCGMAGVDPGKIVVDTQATALILTTPQGMHDADWHQVVFVQDYEKLGEKVTLYVDGVSVGSVDTYSGTWTTGTSNSFRVGTSWTTKQYFTGVFVCKYAMKPEEVAFLYSKRGKLMVPDFEVDSRKIVTKVDDSHVYVVVPNTVAGTDELKLVFDV